MALNYRGYNFIIFEPEENLSSGAYFNIEEDNENIYATMLKDINFCFVDKGKYNYKLYLASGNFYKAVEMIRNRELEKNHFTTFITNNYKNLNDNYVSISFYEHTIDKGLFLSNPTIKINKKFLNRFIDNL